MARKSLRGRAGRYIPTFPEELLAKLAPMPGKCLAVYLIVLQLTRLENSKEVKLTTAHLRGFGLSRYDKRRSLRWLEESGIVRVKQKPRVSPLVTPLY